MKDIKNIIGAVFIAIASFIIWGFVVSAYEKDSHLKTLVDSRSSLLESKQDSLNKIDGLNREQESRFSELKRLSLVIPAKKNIAEMITTIEDISSKTGAPLIKFGIGAQKDSKADLPYNLVSLELGLEGRYQSVIIFLEQLEKNIRLIDINSLAIGPKDNIPGSVNREILSFQIKATSYFIKEDDKKTSMPRPKLEEN